MTLDAMGCQTVIAERILARWADYLLALKANWSCFGRDTAGEFIILGQEPS